MTKTPRKKTAEPAPEARPESRWRRIWRRIWRWIRRGVAGISGFYLVLILLFSFVPPPINLYQMSEAWRLGGIQKDWVGWDEIAPVMGRSVVASEDAKFCLHWGFDMAAIRDAIDKGANRGASTLTQQVAKNVFLWQGRSWLRKAMEAGLTPVIELFWSKQRILEVYLNNAEFAEGVFGVQAAAQHYFDVDARDLTVAQAARLAAVLPNPKVYNAGKPGPFVRKRAAQIISGAETIAADRNLSGCFQSSD